MDIERQLLEMYRDPTLTEKPALLGQRGGAYYSEAAVDLIASLHDGRGDVQVVDVRNDGALPDLPADAVVEIPSRIDRDGAHPLPLSPLAPAEQALLREVKAYERLAAEAARTGDRDAGAASPSGEPAGPGRGRSGTPARRAAGGSGRGERPVDDRRGRARRSARRFVPIHHANANQAHAAARFSRIHEVTRTHVGSAPGGLNRAARGDHGAPLRALHSPRASATSGWAGLRWRRNRNAMFAKLRKVRTIIRTVAGRFSGILSWCRRLRSA